MVSRKAGRAVRSLRVAGAPAALAAALLLACAVLAPSAAFAAVRDAGGGHRAAGASGEVQGRTVSWHDGERVVTAVVAADRVALLFEPEARVGPAHARRLARALGGSVLPGATSFAAVVQLERRSAAAALARDRAALRALPAVRDLAPVYYLAGNPGVPLVPTGRVLVRYRPGADAGERARAVAGSGARGGRRLPAMPRAWAYGAASPAAAARTAAAVAAAPGVEWAQPDLLRLRTRRAIPDDPLFPNQWHLRNTGQGGGTAGADANVTPAWDTYRGSANEVIAIVDDGLEITHEDLQANVIPGQSWDFETNDPDPSPESQDDHGTSCGGVAAARGFNALGVSGVAPWAGLVGYKMLDAATDAVEAASLTRNLGLVDILSNSWGPIDDRHLEAPGALARDALEHGATTGRGGLGAVYVWAGGNGRSATDNVNFDGYANSRYTIAVGASTNYGTVAPYSEDGAALVVNAPSSGGSLGITTVDRTGDLGYGSGNYTSTFGGTSSACPLVAGAAALMLQANPQLGWRDVPAILAATAQMNDPADAGWSTNGAGYHVNHKYGFGRVDVAAAVAAAATWTPLGPEASAEASASPALAIPDGSSAGVSSTITLSDDVAVEWVDVWFTADHTKWTQLEVVLTSPAGTESILATAARTSGASAGYANWRFGSARHLGESPKGTWTLTVRDRYAGTAGTFSSWRLKVHGAPAADTTPPVTTHDDDGQWHRSPVTVTLAAADEPGGSGMTGGQSRTEYSRDGGLTWQQGTEVTYRIWKRGGGSGVHTLLYRSTDAAGNTEAARSVDVLMDARAPRTTDDAPGEPRSGPVTVHLTAVDSLFGVTACSGVAATWYSLDGGPWTQGTTIVVTGAGLHWVAYYSVDVAGNAENVKWRPVTVL